MEPTVITVFEIRHENGDKQIAHSHEKHGQDAADSAYRTAKRMNSAAILKGFIIDGIFKKVDLRDHFQRNVDRNKLFKNFK